MVKSQNGAVTRLGDVARVRQSTTNRLASACFNRDPAVLLIIQKTAEANVVKTVDSIHALMSELHRHHPAGRENHRRQRPHHHDPQQHARTSE